MAIAICSECGSPVEIADGEEWEYCPMCENDQVEVVKSKLLNKRFEVGKTCGIFDLKSDDPTSCLNDIEVCDLLNNQAKQITILEKALELAVADKCTFENKVYSMVFGIANGKLACPKKEQWYLEKAKEIMKSE